MKTLLDHGTLTPQRDHLPERPVDRAGSGRKTQN